MFKIVYCYCGFSLTISPSSPPSPLNVLLILACAFWLRLIHSLLMPISKANKRQVRHAAATVMCEDIVEGLIFLVTATVEYVPDL